MGNTDNTDNNDDNAITSSLSSSKRKLATDSEKSDTSDSSSSDSEYDIEDINHYNSNTLVVSSKSKQRKSNSYYNIQQQSSRSLATPFNPSVSKSKRVQHDQHDVSLEHDTPNTINTVLMEKKCRRCRHQIKVVSSKKN